MPGLLDGGRAIDKDGAPRRASRTRARSTLSTPSVFLCCGKGIELAGYIRVEKGGEGGVATDEIEDNVRPG